ncbi:MAG: hypothetical protein Q9M26_08100 [Mariprofundales bacterium]|nr:hypothetical protein [Mariprofundales bacterium]
MDQQQLERLQGTWKRQIRFYSVSMILGLLLLVWCVSHLRAADHAQPWLMVLSVLSGLALFGGLFGFGLALFFNMWHKQ